MTMVRRVNVTSAWQGLVASILPQTTHLSCDSQKFRFAEERPQFHLVSVGVVSDLTVTFALVRLALESADGRVADDGGLFGERRDGRRMVIWTVEVGEGRSGWSIFLSLEKVANKPSEI